ncbi:MAG: sugar phosphate isomerase/epimerase [Clostridia bacterium]|nr:sugar phosphate isomerase/epimerase [Clostridia bacterium]
MKYCVWSSYYYGLSPEDTIREFKAHGFNCCELSFEHSAELMERGDAKKIGEEFGKFAKELEFEISQGHLSYEARICKPEGIKFLKRQIDLFLGMGVKYAVLHCDSLTWRKDERLTTEEIIKENRNALSELLDYIKGTDMVICLENLLSASFVNNIDGLMYFINEFKSENLGICLDTGHLNLTEKDQINFIRKGGKHIKALHLADNDGRSGDQHLMPYGCGNVDFVSVIREMKSLGYDGLYNLEIPGERGAPLEVLGYKLDYIKKMLEYLDKITDKKA